MQGISLKAHAFIGVTILTGFSVLALGLGYGHWDDLTRSFCYLLFGVLASGLKVSLPGVTGTMSVIFLFILIGIQKLGFAETLLMGCLGTLVQCYWNAKLRPKPIQVLFNVASMATAVGATSYVYHTRLAGLLAPNLPLQLVAAASVFFLMNTAPVACVISLTEHKLFRKVWSECYFWSFPYYLVGAAVAGLVSFVSRYAGWQASLFMLPVIYLIYHSYRLYLARLESEKKHVEDMTRLESEKRRVDDLAALHLRTIEALALAIEAKDHTTHAHLCRVQVYALEIGKELGLSEDELQALRAAAVLHDIGKLAVPEHIISKPGRLSPEEFEKMKIHPVVGAEILERVQFPYPVVPIVRSHHEKWDGSGYPQGLKGEEIPVGARILAAVDCLDALASDRQYRRALPLGQAMEAVAAEAGKSFDPKVVEVLKRRYTELDRLAHAQALTQARLSTDLKIENGKAPASGFESGATGTAPVEGTSIDFLASIAAARKEVQMLFELSHHLGNSLSLDETLSVLGVRLKRLIPYDSIAIYALRDGQLVPEYVSGDNFRLFASLQIPVGEGVAGWVAKNCKPILNGNPSVEPGYVDDPSKLSTLRSVLAVPLEGVNGVVGVLALYRAEQDAFTKDHLRILLAITSKIALSVENALKYRMAESSSTIDYSTGLPNVRALFLHLDSELARCRRSQTPLAVLVCGLDVFKQINDKLGDLEGNRVLRAFATKLKESCREYDYVARIGGEEFVLVLPGMGPEVIREKAHHLRRLATEIGHEVCGKDVLSLSIGYSFYPRDGTNAEQLLVAGERAMYAEKRGVHSELWGDFSLVNLNRRTTPVC